jgi:phosphodiesterase/alkaline phosphatase D-like protein
MVNQWDDHEIVDNWYPGEILDLPQYTEKNTFPAQGRQFFGEVAIDAETEVFTVSLKDLDGTPLFTQAIEPAV